ncbi:MAG: YlxR family protein [Bacilli bacterium]|nr:YlxR family protein [Mycoplasmatota bacterium]MDD6264185.1 YlxR family protein [bacterium]MDY2697809.1 YlxR family protein [Bacilli bacterium]MDD6941339.1 YlxR family protein [bacterium]MDY5993577.1 YlxR family protein [Bacilli bacterium]
MKVKKIPLRTCIITKEKLPKRELLRIVRTPEGNVVPDETGKINGHGAYIKKDIAVLEKAKKSKVLDRKLECNIEDSVYEEIRKIIEK